MAPATRYCGGSSGGGGGGAGRSAAGGGGPVSLQQMMIVVVLQLHKIEEQQRAAIIVTAWAALEDEGGVGIVGVVVACCCCLRLGREDGCPARLTTFRFLLLDCLLVATTSQKTMTTTIDADGKSTTNRNNSYGRGQRQRRFEETKESPFLDYCNKPAGRHARRAFSCHDDAETSTRRTCAPLDPASTAAAADETQ